AEDGIRDRNVTGVQTCALPIWPGARAVSGADFEGGEVRGFAPGATSSFNFCFGSFVLAAAAGLRAAAVPRAACLRVAVLLLVFVAIVVLLKFRSWPELP